MAEKLAEGKLFNTALELLQRCGDNLSERLLALKMRILARHFMIGKDNPNGQRIVIPEVRDYFLEETSAQSLRDPVLAAEISEWLDDPIKAVDVLEKHLSKRPDDWEGIRVMALIRLRMGNLEGALQYVQLLPTVAPWRAESFDWLSYVAERGNRPDIVQQAKLRGDEVFGEEGRMFEELRAYLDA